MDKADGSGTQLFELSARDWSPEMVSALGIDPAWLPPTFEGPAVTGGISQAAADADRAPGRHPGHGRRRRPEREWRRRGCGGPGGRRPEPGHVGRDLRRDRSPALRARGSRPRVLPRGARTLASDVGDAVGRRLAALVSRRDRARRGVRPAGRGGRVGRAGFRGPRVPAVPLRRALAAPGSRCPRRVRRALAHARPSAPHPGGARGRRVRPPGRPRPDGRRGHRAPVDDPRVRWRHGQPGLAPHPRRCPGRGDRHGRDDGGRGVRRGAPGGRRARAGTTTVAKATAGIRTTPVASPGPDAARYRDIHAAYRELYPALQPWFRRA